MTITITITITMTITITITITITMTLPEARPTFPDGNSESEAAKGALTLGIIPR